MNKGGITNNNDNKAHGRKGRSLAELDAKYFSNLADNSKFTFYCQKLVSALDMKSCLHDHQASLGFHVPKLNIPYIATAQFLLLFRF